MADFRPVTRNRQNIRHAEIRDRIDPSFEEIHDNLSDCYYNYWKYGQDKEFKVGSTVYNRQPTLQETKLLFDKLHALLWHIYDVKFDIENKKQPKAQQIASDEYDIEEINVDGTKQSKKDKALKAINELKKEGIELDF